MMRYRTITWILVALAAGAILLWQWSSRNGPDAGSEEGYHSMSSRGQAGKNGPAGTRDLTGDDEPTLEIAAVGAVGYVEKREILDFRDILEANGLDELLGKLPEGEMAAEFFVDADGVIKHVAVNRGMVTSRPADEAVLEKIRKDGISVRRKGVRFARFENREFLASMLTRMIEDTLLRSTSSVELRVTPLEVTVHQDWENIQITAGNYDGVLIEALSPSVDSNRLTPEQKELVVDRRTKIYLLTPQEESGPVAWTGIFTGETHEKKTP